MPAQAGGNMAVHSCPTIKGR